MGLGNPQKGYNLITGGTVGNALATALAPARWVPIQNCDSVDVFIKVNTVGSMTDLRVRPYISVDLDPADFDPTALTAEWTPVPTETITAGAAVQDPYEASFAAATWFPADGRQLSFRIPAIGTKFALAIYDGAGVGTSSDIDVVVYPRRV
jgi:hypothetical protein